MRIDSLYQNNTLPWLLFSYCLSLQQKIKVIHQGRFIEPDHQQYFRRPFYRQRLLWKASGKVKAQRTGMTCWRVWEPCQSDLRTKPGIQEKGWLTVSAHAALKSPRFTRFSQETPLHARSPSPAGPSVGEWWCSSDTALDQEGSLVGAGQNHPENIMNILSCLFLLNLGDCSPSSDWEKHRRLVAP